MYKYILLSILMWASRYGYTKIVEILIKKGTNVNAKTKHDMTALMLVSAGGHTEIVKLLKAAGATE